MWRPKIKVHGPSFGAVESIRRQLQKAGDAVLQQAAPVPARQQIEVGGAQRDRECEAEPRGEQDGKVVRQPMPHIKNEGVARDEERDA
jgi:hypothetical protein